MTDDRSRPSHSRTKFAPIKPAAPVTRIDLPGRLLGVPLIEATVPISNPFENRCRKQTDIAEQCLAVNAGLLQIIKTLQERSGPRFGEQLQDHAVLRLDQMGGYALERGNHHRIPIAKTPTQHHANANEARAPAKIRSDEVVEMLAIFECRLRIVADGAVHR